jgi:hypothetical protein
MMNIEIILGCVGIAISVIGWLIFKSVKKQKNKIIIKSKGSTIKTGDIVGGDKIFHGPGKGKK